MGISKNNKKVLIVGAGLAGATMARILAENAINVFIIDKRNHIAGNAYDFINPNKERIHKYGPHFLHCNKDSEALKFLSRFTNWIRYEHKVRALLPDGRTTPLPINQITLEDIFNKKFLNNNEAKNFLDSLRNKELSPKNIFEYFEFSVGKKLSEIFFEPYTKKMWGPYHKGLSARVGERLPIRIDKDCRYFNDDFQALPSDGYASMVQKMITHENIQIQLETPFEKKMENDFDHSFLCIPIDKYFNYINGVLPYRSILFEDKKFFSEDLPSSVINFTDNSIYTRKTQWSLLPNSNLKKNSYKTITYEIPCSIKDNPDEYFYPVQNKFSNQIYIKYKQLAKKNKNVTFCGRAGLFKYIDMIPAVLIHLKLAREFIRKINNE